MPESAPDLRTSRVAIVFFVLKVGPPALPVDDARVRVCVDLAERVSTQCVGAHAVGVLVVAAVGDEQRRGFAARVVRAREAQGTFDQRAFDVRHCGVCRGARTVIRL